MARLPDREAASERRGCRRWDGSPHPPTPSPFLKEWRGGEELDWPRIGYVPELIQAFKIAEVLSISSTLIRRKATPSASRTSCRNASYSTWFLCTSPSISSASFSLEQKKSTINPLMMYCLRNL